MKFLSLLTRSAALVAVATTVTTPLLAYRIARINGAPNLGWSSGNIVMNLHFGTSFASGGTTVDGFPSYDGPVDAALAIWNQVLGRSSFTVIHNATFTPTLGDGKNSIYFATTTPLGAFPANAVAMTFLRYSGSRIIEADIVLNSAKLWNSYRGALLTANGGQPLNDIRRIALRELGRGLGLDYPDQDTPPQVVTAQMNFTTTPLDTLAQDDVDGIQTLYDVPVTNARFANLSTRGFTGTGDSVLIGGLVVEGSVSKRFYVRVLGPSLTGFGVVGALSDPTIELFGQGGNLLARNDNWKDTQEAEIRQTGFPPFDDRDCGLIATLPAGAFTGIVSGKNGATGVSIIEVYDFAPDNTVHLTNISTRGFVGAGDNVLIGGIVINGPEEQRIMVRVLGPSLAGYGVGGALSDPMVEVHDQAGNLVASNDDWKDTQEAEIRQGGILPLDDLDCGLVITLASGNYTVIVRGYHGATGVGIFEAFRLGRTVLRPSLNSFAGTFVAPGSSTRFTATVVNTANQAVLWSVTGGGVISADGTYTAPATPPTGPVTVTVRAAADPGIFQVFDVTVATPGAASFSSALRLLPNQGTDGNFDPFTGNNTVNGITLMADGGSPLSHYTWYPTTGAVQPLGVILEPATGILKSSGVRNRVTTGLFHVTVSDGSRTANGVVSFVAANGSSDPALLNPLGVAVFSQLNLAAFALVNATANRAYGATLYADIGGGGLAAVLPLTWTLVAGSLPEGLALDAATGVVRGNVLSSAAGRNYSFRVQVRDAAGRLANVVGAGPLYTIRVDP